MTNTKSDKSGYMCVKSRGEGKVETMAERVKSGYALKVDDNTIQYNTDNQPEKGTWWKTMPEC